MVTRNLKPCLKYSYADDTIILASSSNDLQRGLAALEEYCNRWKLKINCSKTKVLIFESGKVDNEHFVLGGKDLDIVREFKYLGILFSCTNNFKKCQSALSKQASRAMHSL